MFSTPYAPVAIGAVVVAIIMSIIFMYTRWSSGEKQPQRAQTGIPPPTSATSATNATNASMTITESPADARLANFAFEPMTKPGFVPLAKAVKEEGSDEIDYVKAALSRKPAGNPPYKLFGCQSAGAYAIRWNGKFLAVEKGEVWWVDDQGLKDSCFKIVPGYCNDDRNRFVMLRSVVNRHFLRFSPETGDLVCKDSPTGRTASQYCWKLQPETTAKQPCGAQYSFDLGRVIHIPCNVKTTPSPGQSCSTTTLGYQAGCCIAKKNDALNDGFCTSTVWFDVVGRPINEAIMVLRTRRPDFTYKPCPEPCGMKPVPVQNANMVVIPYDARSGIVTSPARRMI
jgi:hypothetical protein